MVYDVQCTLQPAGNGAPLAQSGQVPGWASGICLGPASAAQAQALDQGIVTGLVLALHVVQQAPALADHDQKAAARVEILAMSLEMLGKLRDALQQDGDLNFRRSGDRKSTRLNSSHQCAYRMTSSA